MAVGTGGPVMVVARKGQTLGFCMRTAGTGKELARGVADGRKMTPGAFERSMAEGHEGIRAAYPEARIVYVECPDGVEALAFAGAMAEELAVGRRWPRTGRDTDGRRIRDGG